VWLEPIYDIHNLLLVRAMNHQRREPWQSDKNSMMNPIAIPHSVTVVT
jgi:hypothetical protein